MTTGIVLSVNVATAGTGTGIDKRPVDGAVAVRAPGPKRPGQLSGLVGDHIDSLKHHGGNDQAVYAYAREDYDWWAAELSRELSAGLFGENLTTAGIDVNGALIGEVWQIGSTLRVQATFGRIPCAKFQRQMGEPNWVKRFGQVSRSGAYLRVVTPGDVRAGDPIEVVSRPVRSLTIADAYRIYLHEPASIGRLLDAEALPAALTTKIKKRLTTANATKD